MELDLTIAICAYNAAGRLRAALEAVARQQAPGIAWEVLVIDNNSDDATSDVARELGQSLALPLRVEFEPEPGLCNARRRAAISARGRLLSYIDDDNLIEPDWIVRCSEFLDAHPRCGVVGARIDPIFEVPASRPPDFQERFAEALAVRNLSDQPMQLLPPQYDGSPGAGMTGRTALFRAVLLDVSCRLTGVTGTRRLSGEDSEICLILHRLGWEMWFNPAMRLGHVLPPGRLSEAYLEKLIVDGSESQPWLDYLRGIAPLPARLHYYYWWAFWIIASAKNAMLARLRGAKHPHAKQMRFWAKLFRHRARGYWELATIYPFHTFESRLAAVGGSARPPKDAVQSQAGHLVA